MCDPADESVVFFDRLVFVKKCERASGSELTTRTNVLLVRQHLLTPEGGVMLRYSSQRNTKRSHQGKLKAPGASAWRFGVVVVVVVN